MTPDASGIVVAYCGHHQIYQLALAAHELGELNRFYCTLFDAPGKWGGLAARFFGASALINRRCPEIPGAKVAENPWPQFAQSVCARVGLPSRWPATHDRFDRWVAHRLAADQARVFVGVETCARHSFEAARRLGMKTLLEIPGVGTALLDRVSREAAADLGLPVPPPCDAPELVRSKERELELADAVLVCSELQRRVFAGAGVPPDRIRVAPLWVDCAFWQPPPGGLQPRSGRLKVIYAGRISFRKGIPYLLAAMEKAGADCELTLVGPVEPDMAGFLSRCRGQFRLLAPQTKERLRALYWEHDALVLPSLGDSFGFVAMEAMACGLPVIVTDNCGVPVPDERWRAPVMDAGSIADRLRSWAADPERRVSDGRRAAAFATSFTAARYRTEAKGAYSALLAQAA